MKNLVDLKEHVAITGSNGFVGSKLNQRLPNARILDLDKKHRLEEIDTLKTFLEDVKVVFHLAGISPTTIFSLI
uniref:NAD-dependent epimerase/dehydratase domain-containing protein n=1 Tax=uncultured Desulfobacterium sp. TaxID=201089 RepID=E1YIZ5_9BACT|nr:unknown protein [uncultured Desulfobacterium sp.]